MRQDQSGALQWSEIIMLIRHKEPAPILGPFSAWKPLIPYAIKNRRGASVPKPLVGGFGCHELVLYGIRYLVEQHYENISGL